MDDLLDGSGTSLRKLFWNRMNYLLQLSLTYKVLTIALPAYLYDDGDDNDDDDDDDV